MTATLTAEATGETVAEAKAKALQELERSAASIDPETVEYQVVSEGKRGLLGVGYAPARVVASAAGIARTTAPPRDDESDTAAHVRELLENVTSAIGVVCTVEIEEHEGVIVGRCDGDDLGLLIGRHGQTIDAIQLLANAIAGHEGEARTEIVIDAAGYRDRRRQTLEATALRAADDVIRTGTTVSLEAMSAAERKVVHERLKDVDGVLTGSEGVEPYRYVIVEPA